MHNIQPLGINFTAKSTMSSQFDNIYFTASNDNSSVIHSPKRSLWPSLTNSLPFLVTFLQLCEGAQQWANRLAQKKILEYSCRTGRGESILTSTTSEGISGKHLDKYHIWKGHQWWILTSTTSEGISGNLVSILTSTTLRSSGKHSGQHYIWGHLWWASSQAPHLRASVVSIMTSTTSEGISGKHPENDHIWGHQDKHHIWGHQW